MTDYRQPLSIIFVWHPQDAGVAQPIVDHCAMLLSRNVDQPFSRAMNLPVFFRTSNVNEIPSEINTRSIKTMIFVFISTAVMANDEWNQYINKIPCGKDIHIIPVALDKTALKSKGILDGLNYIRAYEFDESNINDYIFLAVAHEIYRWTLNESFSEMALGKDNAIRIFLSHAKDGKNGIKLATELKDFIDKSPMQNFFDATDIGIGKKFEEEIVAYIKQSTIIAIHSDTYSSRYWCQREILSAKENDRPIIVVDCIGEYEDRRFPFASNVPSVYVHFDDAPDKKDLLRILESTLLETLRFSYSKLLLEQFNSGGWIEANTYIISRPPEVSDIDKVLINDGNAINRKYDAIMYPEPPLYSEELSFLSNLGIRLDTPLTYNLSSLFDKKIGISISDPSINELTAIGQNNGHLIRLSQDLARHLLIRCAVLVYGGDLRQDGFTEFIFNEAQALQARLKTENIHVLDYMAWPIYKNPEFDFASWKANYSDIAEIQLLRPPDDVKDLITDEESFLRPNNAQNLFVWSRCLTEMRNVMIQSCDVRICAGGRHSGYKGKMPGVLEEILIAMEMKRPLYLLGGFGGVTASVCKIIAGQDLPELSLDWQVDNNPGYQDFLDFAAKRNAAYSTDYTSIVEMLKNAQLNNGLSAEDNTKLFTTPFAEEALFLIFKGLNSLYGN